MSGMGMWGQIGNWMSEITDRGRSDYWHEQDQRWNEEKEKRDWSRAGQTIQQRVRDAEAAGVHPLYAIGSGTTFQPSVGMNFGVSQSSGAGMPGQNLSRSMKAVQTDQERKLADLQEELLLSQIRRQNVESDALEFRMDAQRNAQVGPAAPQDANAAYAAPGAPPGAQGRGWMVQEPSKYTSRSPGDTSTESASTPFWRPTEVIPGVHGVVPSKAVTDDWQDSLPLMYITIEENWKRDPAFLGKLMQRYLPSWYSAMTPVTRIIRDLADALITANKRGHKDEGRMYNLWKERR